MNPPKNNSNSINSSLPTGVITLEIIEIPNEMENRQLMKKINSGLKKDRISLSHFASIPSWEPVKTVSEYLFSSNYCILQNANNIFSIICQKFKITTLDGSQCP